MIAIGQIKSILNNDLIIVESNIHLDNDDELVVFEYYDSEQIKNSAGLERIAIPKGKLKVLCKQSTNKYLVTTRFTKQVSTTVIKNPFLNFPSMGISSEEVIKETLVQKQASVNESDNLNLVVDTKIKVGDLVSKKDSI